MTAAERNASIEELRQEADLALQVRWDDPSAKECLKEALSIRRKLHKLGSDLSISARVRIIKLNNALTIKEACDTGKRVHIGAVCTQENYNQYL